MIIGLTGPTGSGKSEASQYLYTKGFRVVDADEIVNEIYTNCSECVDRIGFNFAGVVENGVVNKRKLSKIVFSDENMRIKLENIVNPYILSRINACVNEKNNCDFVLDAPTLFESGAYKICDYSVAILSKKEKRLERIVERDGIDFSDAVCRINAQPKDEFYISHADRIIFNNSEFSDFICNIDSVISKLF